jgi:ribonucleoside-triphosphate reductase
MRKITDGFTDMGEHNVSLLATSAEGISGNFPKHDKEVYGEIAGITDKDYYTNSFHVPVNFEVSCFEKIKIESPFHTLCNGGCISYVELAESPANNPEAIVELVSVAHKSEVNYFGINFPLDICSCGHRGVLANECPYCGGTEIKHLRRVSGYLSEADRFARGKKAELNARKASTFGTY